MIRIWDFASRAKVVCGIKFQAGNEKIVFGHDTGQRMGQPEYFEGV